MYRLNNTLTIDTNISNTEFKHVYSRSLNQAREQNQCNMLYFQKYVRFLFDTEIPEEDYKKIFNKLLGLKANILFSIENVSITSQLFIHNVMKLQDPYYVNNTRRYLSTQVFISEYFGKKCIVKIYIYNKKLYPEYKDIIEYNFVNEVLYQTYAHTLNKTCDFISPEIYEHGQITGVYVGGQLYTSLRCRFIVMEYLPFIQYKDAIFNEKDCGNLIQRKEKLDHLLKTKLLHHNDLHNRNVLLDQTHDKLAIIDFGESGMGPLQPIG